MGPREVPQDDADDGDEQDTANEAGDRHAGGSWCRVRGHLVRASRSPAMRAKGDRFANFASACLAINDSHPATLCRPRGGSQGRIGGGKRLLKPTIEAGALFLFQNHLQVFQADHHAVTIN